MLSAAEYTTTKQAYDARHALVLEYCKAHKTNAIPAEASKDWPQCSNEQTSQLEVYEFVNNPPAKYFAYVKHEPFRKGYTGKYEKCTITTWIGDILAEGYFTTGLYRSNFGDTRIQFTAKGINGKAYLGTFYYSAGDYCRMRAAK